MKKNNIKLLISIVFFMMIFILVSPTRESRATVKPNKTLSLKRLNRKAQKVKRETIGTRKQLIRSFTKHIINLDTKFSYKISKKALKNFGKDFDRLWDEFTDNPSYNEIFKYSTINYRYNTKDSFLYLDATAKYKISKNQARKLLKKLDKKIITNRSELAKRYTSHILKFDKKFRFNISKKLLAYSYDDIDAFREELSSNPAYNDIMEHCDLKEDFYEYKNYWEWIITPKLNISETKAREILNNVTPIIKTKEELINKMIVHINRLDKKFSFNLTKNISNLDDAFWDSLYEFPEFVDIYEYSKDLVYYTTNYNGYDKITITCKYDITKQEVNQLNSFVKNWVSKNINSSMSQEEKIRAINDFMVREYRYTFGDRGEMPEGSPDYGKEKIGKYSVYSCFALLYEKGGVCDAKAKMFYRLAKASGFEVLYLTGNVSSGLHAWNMVKIENKWYHIDTTWNRGQYDGSPEYEYFNTRDYYLKSDSSMSGTHSWNRANYPAAYEDYPLHDLPFIISGQKKSETKLKPAA